MPTKPISLGIGVLMVMGAVDTASLSENPISRTEYIAGNVVRAEQKGNVVEVAFPWKDQPGFTVKYDMGEPSVEERVRDKRKREVITEQVAYGDGGFKVDIILNEKPSTNCFAYQIEGWEDYDFFYQPPLTEQEIAEGVERPEEIVGSYAVYHKTLKDHRLGGQNYATGKVAHIPYPYIWEVNNATATKQRAESFTIENGVMNVCVNQSFLDTATYPVRIDPTFGYTTLGATSGFNLGTNPNIATRIGQGYNLAVDGYLTQINIGVYKSTADTSVRMAAFLNTEDTATDSHTEIAKTQKNFDFIAFNPFWANFDFPLVAITADDYVINGLADGETIEASLNDVKFRYDTGSSINIYFESVTAAGSFDTLYNESPWTETDSTSSSNYSIYATYCVNGDTCTESFTTPGTQAWTAPTGVSTTSVACWGGGGGGADGGTAGASSGGGGAYAAATVTVVPGDTYYITVGSGGAQTQAGTDSIFATAASSTLVLADNGTGGVGATANGLGGTTANSSGTIEFAGGNGNDGNGTQDVGGGGGGAGGPNGAGTTGEIGQSTRGGGGGFANGSTGFETNYGISTSINGGSGTASTTAGGSGGGGAYNGGIGGNGGAPGGGGGGGEATGGAAGAAGQCILTYTIPEPAAPVESFPVEELYFLSYRR